MNYIARYYIKEKDNKKEPIIQNLKNHLLEVALLAESFGMKINCPMFMKLAGLIHDIGKFGEIFQSYIINKMEIEISSQDKVFFLSKEKVDHGVYGGKYSKRYKR